MSEQSNKVTDENNTGEVENTSDYSECSWSIVSGITARFHGTPYADLWRTAMGKLAVNQSISDTQEELRELVLEAPLPPELLKSRIEPFLNMPTRTQAECDEAQVRLHDILDLPFSRAKFPPNYPTMDEMAAFRINLTKVLGLEGQDRFWKLQAGLSEGNGGYRKEKVTARQDMIEMLGITRNSLMCSIDGGQMITRRFALCRVGIIAVKC
ncbi:hypothetical protein EAF04_000163 [Stromatinia cepivora]|nr:hypothetical protein EAF04_000163 [Stromatinia cepivora]